MLVLKGVQRFELCADFLNIAEILIDDFSA